MKELLDQIYGLSPEKRATLALNNRLSFGQERLWFLHQLAPDSPAYNIPAALQLMGELDVPVLELTLNEIARRHEILRTGFVAVDGYPMQIVSPSAKLTVNVVGLAELPEEARQRELRSLIAAEAKRPFDLVQGPLLRTTLIVLGEKHYVVLFTMHHIISDAWSTGVFVSELTTLYGAFINGERASLPELPIQYADYAQWQRESLDGEEHQAQIAYWKEQLRGCASELQLPTDHPRPKIQTTNGGREFLFMPPPLSEKLKALSRRETATLFMTLLAAFKTLLFRYSGQEDISTGTPISNRNRLEVEGLIGFFVNTLVLRTSLSGNPTFRELLKRVKEVSLGAYAHQETPLERLVEELQTERNLSHSPLFQVMFDLQNVPAGQLELPGLGLSFLETSSDTEQFDLSLSMSDTSQGLRASLGYNRDLFDRATITRMLNHYQMLLEAIAANPDARIADLPMMTEAERHQVVATWNETRSAYDPDRCIHKLFEAQAARTPNNIAVVDNEQSLTYGELNRRANQLARYLKRIGAGPDQRIGICIERSLNMVVALLGVIKAGAAYVPLDPYYPRKRLSFYLNDSQVSLLLTEEQFAEAIPQGHDVNVICVDTDRDHLTLEGGEDLETSVTPENLFCVIYTSGTTGQPKGVMLTHRGICNRLLWEQSRNPMTETDAVLQTSSLNFDISIWELLTPLLAGGRVVLARSWGYQDGAYLIDTISKQNITVISCVPSMLRVLLEQEGIEKCSSLKRALSGGEAMPIDLQEEFFSRLQAELHNSYGPTETSIDATFWACERDDIHHTVPIGAPIANMQVYILDADFQPAPIGVPGHLHISGVGLARGYLNLPELTAEKFIADPFSPEPGMRMYRTGDKARFLVDGTIEFLGRLDEQVKLRGFRIELLEIETALAQQEAIREAVVILREDEPGDKSLVAYLVLADRQELNISNLRNQLREALPEYMVPSYFVQLDAIPRTLNGKIDKRALPPPGRFRPEIEEDFVCATTPLEMLITNIWAEALKLDRVGIHDNFFDLGGHSLLAVRVHNRLCKELETEIPLLRLFEYPTVQTLAQFLSNSKESQASSREQTQDWARHRRASLLQLRERRAGA